MKKFLLALSAMFVAVAANAQLYICGAGTIGETALGWDPSAPYEVTKTDGVYKFTVTETNQIKMSTVKAQHQMTGHLLTNRLSV